MNTRDFSVVICAYADHRWDDICAAVTSVQGQTVSPREIILVVDHNPALLQRARDQLPCALAIENREPRGLSGARNTGVAASRGSVIAFLDDDAIAAPGWLERLAAGYDIHDVLGVGGAIEPRWPVRRPAWFPAEFDWVVGCTYRGLPEHTAPVRNLIGANMSFRRSVFETVGGFRNEMGRIGTLPAGCEETEFCIRVRQHWTRGVLLYEPSARVAHRVSPERTRLRYFGARCYAEGRSKAQVARAVGHADGLASERAYTLYTLPQGVVNGVRDTFLQSNLAGLARAGSIITGLMMTAAGYLVGAFVERRTSFAPLQREHGLREMDT